MWTNCLFLRRFFLGGHSWCPAYQKTCMSKITDDVNDEDIKITLGTVKGYKGKAYKTLSALSRSSLTRSLVCSSLRHSQYAYLVQSSLA